MRKRTSTASGAAWLSPCARLNLAGAFAVCCQEQCQKRGRRDGVSSGVALGKESWLARL